MISLFEIMNESDRFSAFMHHPRMCLSTDFIFEQRIGHVPLDVIYIRFTH